MTPAIPNLSSERRVRLACDADVPALLRLRAAWTYENDGVAADAQPDPEYAAAFERWWQRERDQRVTWLAEIGTEPVGMLNMLVFTRMPRPGRTVSQWGYVANVFVLAEHRGKGLGRRLLDASTAHADGNGYVRLMLHPAPGSLPFYERAGFGVDTTFMTRA